MTNIEHENRREQGDLKLKGSKKEKLEGSREEKKRGAGRIDKIRREQGVGTPPPPLERPPAPLAALLSRI